MSIMSYEAFREQCAQIAERMPDFSRDAFGPVQHRIATTIRSQPLPEVKQEPMAWFANTEPAHKEPHYVQVSDEFYKGYTFPLYALPPDAEYLRKENEKLRAALGSLSKRCYIMSESHQVNDVRGARLIVGFNNIVDAGDAHSAISALKGGAA